MQALKVQYSVQRWVGFDKGVQTIKSNNDDDFGNCYRQKNAVKGEILSGSKLSNADFELARNQKLRKQFKTFDDIGGREKET
jgi:uncharacterized protein YjbI with pentapeptide repeats